MRIKGNDLSTLVFLVDHHLTMSEIARRKNLDDEDTIIEFARIVQTQERLDLLMLLTFADTLGTGSGRGYSDWKDLLLWQLYHRTTSALSGVKEFRAMAEKARLEIQQRLLKNLDRQFDPAEVVAHFENLPPSYFETMSEELIREHIAHRARLPQVPDHPRRRLAPAGRPLAQFPRAGPLRGHRRHVGPLSHLRARHRLVRRLQPDHSQGRHFHPRRRHRHRDLLRRHRAARGRDRSARPRRLRENPHPGHGHGAVRLRPGLRQASREAALPRLRSDRICPRKVSVDLRASQTHALLDVQTADYPGLLYRIACAIADAELNLASARITTEKGAALDTFYLTDRSGKKIESEEILTALIEEVRKRIAA